MLCMYHDVTLLPHTRQHPQQMAARKALASHIQGGSFRSDSRIEATAGLSYSTGWETWTLEHD